MKKNLAWTFPLSLVLVQSVVGAAAQADDYPAATDQLCNSTLNFHDGDDVYHVRYCRNRALSSVNNQVTRAVIVIPGSKSPAVTYYQTVRDLAIAEGVEDTTTIIVPSFLEDDGKGTSVLEQLNLDDSHLFWSPGWRNGDRSSASAAYRISSFALVDTIVLNLIDNNPKLTHIAVVGHSAGGRFTNRYAAGTSVVQIARESVSPQRPDGVSMSFGVFAAGQVLYLDDWRPNDGEKKNCDGVDDVPGENEGDYRVYPRGLVNVENHNYMNDSTKSDIRTRLFNRHIYYTVGLEDLDAFAGCDKVQGDTHVHLQRGYATELWRSCLASFGGGNPSICQAMWFRNERAFGELPGVDHSHKEEYETRRGLNILFHWK